jgi:acyl-CoA synthetase (AMP-forming)/AMP-acid ligase II
LSTSSSDPRVAATLSPGTELLWDRWCRWADERPEHEAIVHWTAEAAPFRWTWRALLEEAEHFANRLAAAGIGAGEVCAVIARHHAHFYPLYLGISALGAIPSVLAYPNPRLHPHKFVHGLQGMARRSGLDWILTERSLEGTVRPLALGGDASVRGLIFPFEGEAGPLKSSRFRRPPVHAGSACLLQHSSGTTGLQKAVVLSHRAVLEHVGTYADALRLQPGDKVASWLPLYHDMGMIAAFHLPLALGIPVVQLDPFEWVSAPEMLLQVISQERATLSWLPNFAYNLLADRVRDEELRGVRLDSMRMFINCSEPVRADSHGRFLERFSAVGLPEQSLAACYAMAETTFAATQTSPGEAARTLDVDRDALSHGLVRASAPGAPTRACVSSGRPIPGCQLRIVDDLGETVAPAHVGEIAIRSSTMFDGYRNAPDDTARVLRDGWYFSGDYGFELDGEYYVVGRKKDLIIVAGRNIYPEDVEDAISLVPGVLAGRVVAFGLEDASSGTEQIAVIAETEAIDAAERKRIKLAIQRAGMEIDVTVARVFLASPRWLIKSSAGKPSRKANRQRVLDGELAQA